MAKLIHFVITINLEDGTKQVDDDTLTAIFHSGTMWDTDTQEWGNETEEEYEAALAILNNKEIPLD